MNNCTFIGRIGRDAETRQAGSSDLTSWPVAVDVGYGDKKTTLWLDCSWWGERGTKLAGYIKKGDNIGVNGELSLREYTKNDVTKTVASLRINDVKLLAAKQDAAPQQRQQARPAAQPARQPEQRQPSRAAGAGMAVPSGGFDDDDIPFAPMSWKGLA